MNIHRHCHSTLFILIALLTAAFVYMGCEEIDVPVIIDSEEIQRYIAESDDAIELFRRDNIITGDPYEVPGDSGAVYTDIVDSVKRTISVFILIEYREELYDRDYIQDFGPPVSLSRDAEATVEDRFYVRTTRVKGDETSVMAQTRSLTRYGYFLKLGDDNQAFVGWKLMAFSGGGPFPPTRVQVVRQDSSIFLGDSVTYDHKESLLIDATTTPWDTLQPPVESEHSYLDLSGTTQIARIPDGEALQFRLSEQVDSSVFFTVTGETNDGFHNMTMVKGSDSAFSVILNTPDNNSRPWNIVYLQEFRRYWRDTTTVPSFNNLRIKTWCVPYRTE